MLKWPPLSSFFSCISTCNHYKIKMMGIGTFAITVILFVPQTAFIWPHFSSSKRLSFLSYFIVHSFVRKVYVFTSWQYNIRDANDILYNRPTVSVIDILIWAAILFFKMGAIIVF